MYTRFANIASSLAVMAEKYSELEVAPNEQREPLPEAIDQGANAPERDLSADAPELAKKPQVSCNALSPDDSVL